MKRGNGSTLVAFINATMNPTRYVQDHARLDSLQGELNAVLVLYGFRVTDQGQLVWGATASLRPCRERPATPTTDRGSGHEWG